jgi:TolA-binding protein
MCKGRCTKLSLREVVSVTDREDRCRVHVEIPVETKQAMKDSDGPMWKLIDEGVRMALGLDEGSTEAAIVQRLKEIKQERNELHDQLESVESRLDELDTIEDDLEERLEHIREQKESHYERLDSILSQMLSDERNRPVMAWMPEVKEAAVMEYGSDSKQNVRRIIEDLRSHALEEGYAIESDRLSRSASVSGQPANADGGESDLRILKGDSDD